MYPQLSEPQKSIISLYFQSVKLLNDNKNSVHEPVLKTLHELLLDEMKESLKNHSIGDKIEHIIHNSSTDYNNLMARHNNGTI